MHWVFVCMCVCSGGGLWHHIRFSVFDQEVGIVGRGRGVGDKKATCTGPGCFKAQLHKALWSVTSWRVVPDVIAGFSKIANHMQCMAPPRDVMKEAITKRLPYQKERKLVILWLTINKAVNKLSFGEPLQILPLADSKRQFHALSLIYAEWMEASTGIHKGWVSTEQQAISKLISTFWLSAWSAAVFGSFKFELNFLTGSNAD